MVVLAGEKAKEFIERVDLHAWEVVADYWSPDGAYFVLILAVPVAGVDQYVVWREDLAKDRTRVAVRHVTYSTDYTLTPQDWGAVRIVSVYEVTGFDREEAVSVAERWGMPAGYADAYWLEFGEVEEVEDE